MWYASFNVTSYSLCSFFFELNHQENNCAIKYPTTKCWLQRLAYWRHYRNMIASCSKLKRGNQGEFVHFVIKTILKKFYAHFGIQIFNTFIFNILQNFELSRLLPRDIQIGSERRKRNVFWKLYRCDILWSEMIGVLLKISFLSNSKVWKKYHIVIILITLLIFF